MAGPRRYNLAVQSCDVLIAGAGPTGLVLALWLTRAGVRVRVIDKIAEPGTTSRALGVQARTLEFYRQLGGEITLIAKPGVNHHPHGLDDSTPIIEFIEKHCTGGR